MNRPAQHPASTTDARKRGTEILTVGTWNAGNGTDTDGREVMDLVDALCGQEFSDRGRLLHLYRTDGYKVICPPSLGAPATPLIYDPRTLLFVRPLLVPMLQGRELDWGPGTGPDHGKPKWLVGGYFIHKPSRRRVAIASTHKPAGHKPGNQREDAATLQSRRSVEAFRGYTGIPIIGADNNAEPDSPCMDPLRHGGWKIDQLVGKRIPTHGPGWCPDHICWRDDDRISLEYHRVIANRSDHRADIATFALTVRAGGTR